MSTLQRLKTHTELGLRWIRCGWRLFQRNPWLLAGMGLICSAAAVAIEQVPLAGGPFLGLLAPMAAASFYISIDGISKQKMKLPPALRVAAIKQSPREFLNVGRKENWQMQVLVMGLYSLVVVVLTDIVIWVIAGGALANPLAGLSLPALAGVAIVTLLRFVIYLLLAASLVFTIPLGLLQKQALVPAMVDSLRRALHYGIALIAIIALLLVPALIGAAASFYSTWLGYLLGFLAGAAVLPIAACSLYCSYRTVFPLAESPRGTGVDLKRANYV